MKCNGRPHRNCLPINHNIYVLRFNRRFSLGKFVHNIFVAFWFECRNGILHHQGGITFSVLGGLSVVDGMSKIQKTTHLSQSKIEQELSMLRVLYQKCEGGDSRPFRRIVRLWFIPDTVLEDLFMRKKECTGNYCRHSNIDLILTVRWEVDGCHRWLGLISKA